ncbi:MAG: DUF3369 domain-containing protein [Gammaproteobacteria bacterium]|nr:DUF3369 domain-containing protein [Gammaproteobacteria bacterium]
MNDIDTPLFADEAPEQDRPLDEERRKSGTWKIMIVDDEQGVHDITKLALKKFRFQDKSIEFIHAFSGEEAQQLIKQNPDTALILLDVVMETDDAGLKTARYVRDEAKNLFVRIVLRTGQPGQAPEAQVIQDYDINDYKDKTELTVQKLTTVMYASLRSYRDIMALEQSRIGLERVIESTSSLFTNHDLEKFTSGLLLQIASIMDLNKDTFYAISDIEISSFLAGCGNTQDDDSNNTMPTILSGTGRFQQSQRLSVAEVMRGDEISIIKRAIDSKQTICEEGRCVFYFNNSKGSYGLVYFTGYIESNDINLRLMDLFCTNISIAYDNVSLYKEIEETQAEVIFTLGSVAEFRSKETSDHVARVAEYSELLALKAGMDAREAKLVRLASPMHDIGKVAIEDSILQKPGKLTKEEFERMKEHCQIGYDMLKNSDRSILKTAATIAYEHQEKWDGSGYPRGLSGTDIHIYGRITAIADVFDALGSKRCYKDAWPIDEILDLFKDQKSKHFDPELIDLFLSHLDDFLVIRDKYGVDQ